MMSLVLYFVSISCYFYSLLSTQILDVMTLDIIERMIEFVDIYHNRTAYSMTYKTAMVVENMVNKITMTIKNIARKVVVTTKNMTHITFQNCITEHVKMKNNYHTKID